MNEEKQVQPVKNELPVLKEKLSPAQLTKAQELARQLEDGKTNTVLNYGKDVQEQMSSFTDTVLVNVRNKDTGEVGDSLRSLVANLNEANPEKLKGQRGGILRFFGKIKTSVFEMTAKYQEVSVQIEKVSQNLASQETKLLHDNDVLDEMYQANMDYYDSLNILLAGGQMRLEALDKEITDLQAKVNEVDANQMEIQALQDKQANRERLAQRLNDLMLTREITIQQAPQIRLIQNANSILSEKIQSSITTAIPLWKNQVAIAISILRQKDAVNAQNAVADATNDLLKKNSQMLRQSSVEVAQAVQRGVVDVDTLKETQANLIATIKDVMDVQAAGEAKRRNVQNELASLDNNLKATLTTIQSKQPLNGPETEGQQDE
ncbi:toxic anion resistance protein [Limosilactobacillus caccae]|uniref:toxic anion resistance protein n=1 Tax=Limosilactobacillus caccae TaxID=1926284 RepID=UPI000970B6D5|nr:toxic anion resistance protein [Limosilactobacillus caccae]